MKAVVDTELCIGCGACEEVCPTVFEMHEDIAVVKVDELPAGEEEACRRAVGECPTEAISIEE